MEQSSEKGLDRQGEPPLKERDEDHRLPLSRFGGCLSFGHPPLEIEGKHTRHHQLQYLRRRHLQRTPGGRIFLLHLLISRRPQCLLHLLGRVGGPAPPLRWALGLPIGERYCEDDGNISTTVGSLAKADGDDIVSTEERWRCKSKEQSDGKACSRSETHPHNGRQNAGKGKAAARKTKARRAW